MSPQLIRGELNLAKAELSGDLRRVGMAIALLAMSAFVACLMLVILCFAFAYGLQALGIWPWASFLIVAGVLLLLIAMAVLIAILRVRGVTGLRTTRDDGAGNDRDTARRRPAPGNRQPDAAVSTP